MSKRKSSQSLTVEFTERAILALHEIESYSIANWGRQIANQYLQDIQEAIELIRQNPALLRKEQATGDAFLFYRARKHLLICQRTSTHVIVLAIIHTSMDLATRLWELEPVLAMEARMLAAELARRRP